jgi:hypothetical protein
VLQPRFESRWTALARRAARAVGPLGVVTFWSGLSMAVRRFPREYDWRYMTVSSLLSPDRNPAGHRWASGGIVLCGLGGLCWTALGGRRSNPEGSGDRRRGLRALQVGYLCMALAATPRDWLLPLPREHEILALLAFAGLSYGMVQGFAWTLLPRRSRPMGRRAYAAAVVGAAVLPIVLAAIAQAYVFFERPELPWVNLSWRDRGVPVYLSFALWEWITCLVFSADMAILFVATSMAYPAAIHGAP